MPAAVPLPLAESEGDTMDEMDEIIESPREAPIVSETVSPPLLVA